MKVYLRLIALLAAFGATACTSEEQRAAQTKAQEAVTRCLGSNEKSICKSAISQSDYLSKRDLIRVETKYETIVKAEQKRNQEKREKERKEKREKERLSKVREGEVIVNALAKQVNYYQDNCEKRVISRNVFGVERIWENCVGDDLLSGMFGVWGRDQNGWKKAMFLTHEMWNGLSASEKASLRVWLKEHNVRNIYTGRVVPSTRFSANTITIDETVWRN
ncbi:hypothetical protein FZX09_06715 [Synechococcus sp. MU1643]|uniref:hypothetical protein n=1 Tax=Synechococcus sp. MU1643 TaxID=2508349 RepID=UPI001CF815F6|nr:hypothetical protein [Synechococcus sp. MU1643]MCB4428492.1 hypothetical protein [Synechococcus sp. MU1643]